MGLALLLGGAAPGAAAPPCEARIEIEPRRAFVGQRVEHRRVVVRGEGPAHQWLVPPRFPGFRAERMEPAPAERLAGLEPARFRFEVLTLLFPARPGTLRLPPSRLRCGGREIEPPGAEVEVLPWPANGRPDDFSGPVGAIGVSAESPGRIALGASARVHVTLRGAGHLGDARVALRVTPEDTEVFAREPRVSLRPGAPSIRHDAFDLVPQRAGLVRVAPIRIPYLDPETGSYEVATAEALEIRVVPAAAPVSPAEAEPAPGRVGATGEGKPRGRWGWGALASLAALAAAVALARRGLRPADPVGEALRDYDDATNRDARTAALERALCACLAERGLDPTPHEPQALLERSPDTVARECAAGLVWLEQLRFGGVAPTDEVDARLAALRELAARSAAH